MPLARRRRPRDCERSAAEETGAGLVGIGVAVANSLAQGRSGWKRRLGVGDDRRGAVCYNRGRGQGGPWSRGALSRHASPDCSALTRQDRPSACGCRNCGSTIPR